MQLEDFAGEILVEALAARAAGRRIAAAAPRPRASIVFRRVSSPAPALRNAPRAMLPEMPEAQSK